MVSHAVPCQPVHAGAVVMPERIGSSHTAHKSTTTKIHPLIARSRKRRQASMKAKNARRHGGLKGPPHLGRSGLSGPISCKGRPLPFVGCSYLANRIACRSVSNRKSQKCPRPGPSDSRLDGIINDLRRFGLNLCVRINKRASCLPSSTPLGVIQHSTRPGNAILYTFRD